MNKKLLAGIIILVITLAGILYLLINRTAFIGQEVLLESGQSVKIIGTPLEVKVKGFESNCPPTADCLMPSSLEPRYEYRMWGKMVEDDEISFDDSPAIIVESYKINHVSHGDDWTRIQVLNR